MARCIFCHLSSVYWDDVNGGSGDFGQAKVGRCTHCATGALAEMSMVLMHHTEERMSKSAEMRRLLKAMWSTKLGHEDERSTFQRGGESSLVVVRAIGDLALHLRRVQYD